MRNGPQVDYSFPPLPRPKGKSLPDEWSFMPFICLPDGAHASNEEFIYFHLPPVYKENTDWEEDFQGYPNTLFGLACFRQIDASELLNKTADITRTKVQKSVVVLASHCILGSVRTKLGLVTEAFFAQRDFSKLDLIEDLYETLSSSIKSPISDATLFMGLGVREMVHKFKYRVLQLFKLFLLGKRILFYGNKVEKLSVFQYSIVSLVPELTRNLYDIANPEKQDSNSPRNSIARSSEAERLYNTNAYKRKLSLLGHPLRVFGKGSFFQPYVPLQQMDMLTKDTKAMFLAGTSNSIFTQHKACAIDVIANVNTGEIEIVNHACNALAALSMPDRKFITDIVTLVEESWEGENIEQIDFEGSDDDIRAKFEHYVTQLFACIEYHRNPPELGPKEKKIDYLAEYNHAWVAAWENTENYQQWTKTHNQEYLAKISPGHPCHGHNLFTSAAAQLSTLKKNLEPVQSNVGKQLAAASASVSTTVDGALKTLKDPERQQEVSKTANQLLQNFGTWFNSKREQWIGDKNDETESMLNSDGEEN